MVFNAMECPKTISGPYRATKLWNEAIRTFRDGMPTKRHWRHMRQYDNCFSASEAIEWLHEKLKSNPNFGSEVTRDQTVQLLKKFLKAGLFEDVHNSKSASQPEIKNNGELFRFTNKSPFRNLRTPGWTPLRSAMVPVNDSTARKNLSNSTQSQMRRESDSDIGCSPPFCGRKLKQTKENKLPECKLVARPLSVAEVEDVWKTITLDRLKTVLGLSTLDDLLRPELINPRWIVHSVLRVSGKGVVQLLDRADALPPWVLSAMKCLANWPNVSGSGSCLPNYPGFENDVFKVVCDYFTHLGIPLTTFELYDAFVGAFIRAEFMDITCRSSFTNTTVESEQCEQYYLSSFESVENLMLNMTANHHAIHTGLHKTSTPCTESFVASVTERENTAKQMGQWTGSGSRVHSMETLGTQILNSSHKSSENFQDSMLYHTAVQSMNSVKRMKENSEVFSNSNTVHINDNANQISCLTQQATPEQAEVLSASKIMQAILPPNSCFETAFTSESPITRIIPRQSVDTVHLESRRKMRKSAHSACRPASITSPECLRSRRDNCDFNYLSYAPGSKRIRPQSVNGLDSLSADYKTSQDCVSGTESRQVDLYQLRGVDNPAFIGLSSETLHLASDEQSNKNTMLTKYRSAFSAVELDRAGNISCTARNHYPVKCISVDNLDSYSQPLTFQNNVSSFGGINVELDPISWSNSVETRSACGKSKNMIKRNMIKEDSFTQTKNFTTVRRTKGKRKKEQKSAQIYGTLGHFRSKSGGYVNLALCQSVEDDLDQSGDPCSVKSELSKTQVINQSNCTARILNNPDDDSIRYIDESDSRNSFSSQPSGKISEASSGSVSSWHTALSCHSQQENTRSRLFTPHLRCKRSQDISQTQKSKTGDTVHDYENLKDLSRFLSYSAVELSDSSKDRTPFGQIPPFHQQGVLRHYNSSPRLLTQQGKAIAIETLQLLGLLLPVGNRRKLHLLLRFMSKVSNNDKLVLDPRTSSRALLLNTFSRSILSSHLEADYDELLALRIVTFLMDNHEEIMRVPAQLKLQVELKLAELRRGQIRFNVDDSVPLTYCAQVSLTEWERQRMTGSQLALIDLLEQIITDQKLSHKEQKKKLKKFKEAYPHLYQLRFPTAEKEAEVLSAKPKKLTRLTSLTHLKNIRM